ncbi:hypothetical protein AAF712_002840 [Marasmius tenuissimus]|uniref:Uncharacterized protein n=1 Tax=Marasmius tenuissimus TaxID=585030 RepID=A0ABR3A7H5_9AGAR
MSYGGTSPLIPSNGFGDGDLSTPFAAISVVILHHDLTASVVQPVTVLHDILVTKSAVQVQQVEGLSLFSIISAYTLLKIITTVHPQVFPPSQLSELKGEAFSDLHLEGCLYFPDPADLSSGNALTNLWTVGTAKAIWAAGPTAPAFFVGMEPSHSATARLIHHCIELHQSRNTSQVPCTPKAGYFSIVIPVNPSSTVLSQPQDSWLVGSPGTSIDMAPNPTHHTTNVIPYATSSIAPVVAPLAGYITTLYNPQVVVLPAGLGGIVAQISEPSILCMFASAGVNLAAYRAIPRGTRSVFTDLINRVEGTVQILERCGYLPFDRSLGFKRSIERVGKFQLNGGTTTFKYLSIATEPRLLGWKNAWAFEGRAGDVHFARVAASREWVCGTRAGDAWKLHQSLKALFKRREEGNFSAPRVEGYKVDHEERLAAWVNQTNLLALKSEMLVCLGD